MSGNSLRQYRKLWEDLSLVWRVVLLSLLTVCLGVMGMMVTGTFTPEYVVVYPDQGEELAVFRATLERLAIPHKEVDGQSVQVPKKYLQKLSQISHVQNHEGFELFDTSTWGKGDKELKVLEMRALKGLLERDLASYDNIQRASVVLDLPPDKSFNQESELTKASVILTLKAGTELESSQLKAIIYHLTGAVRGLVPSRIAISDTTGILYHTIEDDADPEEGFFTALLIKRDLETKVNHLLDKIVGEEHYHTTSSLKFDMESEEIETISLAVMIDRAVSSKIAEKEIFRQLQTIVQGYGVNIDPVIDYAPFSPPDIPQIPVKTKGLHTWLWTLMISSILAVGVLIVFWEYMKRDRQRLHPAHVDVRKLARSIQGEDPRTLAQMLSYLEPSRAEELITAFPESFQEQILFHLTELEREELT